MKHKQKILIRLFATLLCAILFVACTPPNEKKRLPMQEYTAQPSAKEKPLSEFLSDVFCSLLADDYLTLHYTLENPSTYGITPPPATLGTYTAAALQSSLAENQALLQQLQSYEQASPDDADRLLLRLLSFTLNHSLLSPGEEYYVSPLGPTTGLQTQLPILLAEYRFSTPSDVSDYFLLLESMPALFESLAKFEAERIALGCGFCPEVLERISLQCQSFIENPDSNLLIAGFQERLAVFSTLTWSERAELCIRNQRLVLTSVIPAYQHLIESISEMLPLSKEAFEKGTASQGIATLPNGQAFYEHMIARKTGSQRPVAELEALLKKALLDSLLTLADATKNDLSLSPSSSSDDVTPVSILERLKQCAAAYFPAAADVECRLLTVHPSLEDFISPAFYLVPPLDSYTNNVIYINEAKCDPDSLFTTLAHEGYPGHLYQSTYFASTTPHPLRMLIHFPGYEEGFATYAEMFSYQYAGLPESTAALCVAEQVAGLCIYSLADLRLHYHGQSKAEVTSFLTTYGFTDDIADELYYMLLAEPASYLPYSVGYLEICDLYKEFERLTGPETTPSGTKASENEASALLTFHTFLLEAGPAPFHLLREQLEHKFTNRQLP